MWFGKVIYKLSHLFQFDERDIVFEGERVILGMNGDTGDLHDHAAAFFVARMHQDATDFVLQGIGWA